MSPEVWTFAGIVITQLVTLVVVLLQRRQSKRVERKVEPVSNGFAATVLDTLTELSGKVGAMDAKLDRVDALEKRLDDVEAANVVRPLRRRVW